MSCCQAATPSWVGIDSLVDKSLSWTQVADEDREAILRMIAEKCKENLRKIKTLKGSLEISQLERLSAEYVSTGLDGPSTPLNRVSDFTIQFVLDRDLKSIYRSKKTRRVRFLQGNKEVSLPHISPSDETSAVTPKNYLHLDPEYIHDTVVALPDHPQAKDTRVAFRDRIEEAQRMQLGDLVDPLEFFHFSGHEGSFAGSLRLSANWIESAASRGSHNTFIIYQAIKNKQTWYHIERVMGPKESPLYLTSVWNPTVLYHPDGQCFRKELDGGGVVSQVSYNWERVEDILVPKRVRNVAFMSGEGDEVVSYNRDVRIEKWVINEPVSRDQFTVAGIGLKEGEVVVDNINGSVSALHDGELEILGRFGKKKGTPWMAWVAGAIAILFFLVWRILQRGK